MKKILITGGAGFVGSHIAEYYSKKGDNVVVYDNLSRSELLKNKSDTSMFNWNFLDTLKSVEKQKADIRDFDKLKEAVKDVDVILHTAGQTAVTTSVTDPRPDFEVNALGTFNVLEAARLSEKNPAVLFCSTNKVYGDNVNQIGLIEGDKRYGFEEKYKQGVPEDLSVDHCKHTPYGCSKLTADLYMQDYGKMYGLKTGVFRMSCIYGTRQFGVEDQGWIAWFTIASLLGKPLTIYGDGKQVRDVLYVTDLVNLFDKFINSSKKNEVFNTGGGSDHTLSLLELLEILEELTGKKIETSFGEWRPSDQKVYISDTNKAKKDLDWQPKITPKEGIKNLFEWIKENKKMFS